MTNGHAERPAVRGRARTLAEIQFAASLEPCVHCGLADRIELELLERGESWMFAGACSACRRRRTFTFSVAGDPLDGHHGLRHLGDDRPSEIIRPGQFVAELDRCLLLIRAEPRGLTLLEWYASWRALDRALTCVIELRKFVPAGQTQLRADTLTPDDQRDQKARPERYTSAWLVEEHRFLSAVLARYRTDSARIDKLEAAAGLIKTPLGSIDAESLRSHDAWLRAGRRGAGRLDVVGYRSPQARLAGRAMNAARLSDVTLDGSKLDGIQLTDAELRNVSMLGASLVNAVLRNAQIVGGSLARAIGTLAVFDGASIDETDLQRAMLDRSSWAHATVIAAAFDDARFGNANLDDARFVGCTFRRTSFQPVSTRIAASTRAVFEDCDLRGASWTGRDLTGASFIRCKFAGTLGKPLGLQLITIEEPDLSLEGDGSYIGTADDILERWR